MKIKPWGKNKPVSNCYHGRGTVKIAKPVRLAANPWELAGLGYTDQRRSTCVWSNVISVTSGWGVSNFNTDQCY